MNPYLASGIAGDKNSKVNVASANKSPQASSGGWSDAPIDASGLKAVNANISLNMDGFVFQNITVGKSAMTLTLINGVLTKTLSEMSFYQGQGRAKIIIDARQPNLKIGLNASLKGLQVQPFLRDLAGFNKLTGSGNIEINVTGSGQSEKQLVGTLNGQGGLKFANGTIEGIDLVSMIQNVAAAFGVTDSQGKKTEFTEMGGTFVINNGVVNNDDFTMKSPVIQLTGVGIINLPAQSLNYRVVPSVVRGDHGISVPVLVRGPWSNLSWEPDLESIIRDQGKGLLQNLLQGKKSNKQSDKNLERGLNKLFGR